MDIKVQIILIVSVASLIAYVALLFYKSKCTDLECCLKFKSHRDTNNEDKTVAPFKIVGV